MASHETPVALLSVVERELGYYSLDWTFSSSRNQQAPSVEWPSACKQRYAALDCGNTPLLGEISLPQIGEEYSAAVVQIKYLNKPGQSFTLSGANRSFVLTANGRLPWQQVAASYVPLGVEHIMLGVDHLLFVLGLILLVKGTGNLIKTISSFTLAHSLTLAAATLGWVGVPEDAVNAAIALSIVVLAVEVKKYRGGEPCLSARIPWIIAFGFGLLHGFGFSGAMTNIGLPAENLPLALLFFNIGVEIGQVFFVFLVFAIYYSHRNLEIKFPFWAAPAGIYGAGAIASYWFLSRFALLLA
ncbi:MAG: HupE/UreJ family protein [Cellvibrionaceae bacterium]|nr:HupE/UreJ family protein [Cellvibrionaceae bacterium]